MTPGYVLGMVLGTLIPLLLLKLWLEAVFAPSSVVHRWVSHPWEAVAVRGLFLIAAGQMVGLLLETWS